MKTTAKIIITPLFWLLSLFSPLLYSQPIIGTYHLEGLHTSLQSGAYDKVFLKIKEQGVGFTFQFSPIIRAKHNFNNKAINCLSPSDASDSFFPFPTVQSTPINYAKAYIFSRKGEPVINKVEDLHGKKVGIRTGMNFNKELAEHDVEFEIEYVRDIALNYKKLMAKRIDAFIAYTPDIWNLIGSRELADLTYEHKLSLLTHPESVVCHDTPSNRAFIKQFDYELNKLIQQGKLEELLGISYTPR